LVATAEIKLHWFSGVPNFGDRISADVVAAVGRMPVVKAKPRRADLFAVGSILSSVSRVTARLPNPARVVWGSGMMGPIDPPLDLEKVHVAALRGPLTQCLTGAAGCQLGDPGLLITDVVPPPPRDRSRIGIVLHHSETPDPAVVDRLRAAGRFDFIDVTDEDHLGVVARIGACGHVISSSLHGLIVADAFGVPNSWMVNGRIHKFSTFKFYDYALSVKRILNDPVALGDVLDTAARGVYSTDTPDYMANVIALRDGLRAAFPHEALMARRRLREAEPPDPEDVEGS
jgi:pyruvyltransferase